MNGGGRVGRRVGRGVGRRVGRGIGRVGLRPAGGVRAARFAGAAGVPAGVAAGVLAAALALGSCGSRVEEESRETLRETGASALSVELDRGTVEVVGHAGSEVEIEVHRAAHGWSREAARSSLDAMLVEARLDPATGELTVRGRTANAGLYRPGESRSLRLQVRAPAGLPLEVRTGDGRIELEGLSGAVRAMTADGRIRASSLGAGGDGPPARLRTASGRITADDLEGAVVAETGRGRIRIEGRLTEVTAVSGSGNIVVDATGAGSAPRGVWRLRAGDGDVRLRLPEAASASLSVVADRWTTGERDTLAWRRRGVARAAELGDGAGARILVRADDEAEVSVGPRR